MAGEGLVSMTPTSIVHSGTSATINANGGVDFSAITEVSLNGVFTSDYDNYVVVMSILGNVITTAEIRMRASGSDASGTDYTAQLINAVGSSITGRRDTSETSAGLGTYGPIIPGGDHLHMYGPYLSQTTAMRLVNSSTNTSGDAQIRERAYTHGVSSSYDGITLIAKAGDNITGNIHVFGYEE